MAIPCKSQGKLGVRVIGRGELSSPCVYKLIFLFPLTAVAWMQCNCGRQVVLIPGQYVGVPPAEPCAMTHITIETQAKSLWHRTVDIRKEGFNRVPEGAIRVVIREGWSEVILMHNSNSPAPPAVIPQRTTLFQFGIDMLVLEVFLKQAMFIRGVGNRIVLEGAVGEHRQSFAVQVRLS